MTDQATPVQTGGDAQPIADANSIDSIIDAATTPAPAENKETPEAEQGEPSEATEAKPEETFPKKAVNALSRRDKQIGKLRAEREALLAEVNKYRQQPAAQSPQNQGGELSPAKTGIPTKLNLNNFSSWADYSEARAEEIADYKIDKKFADFQGKQEVSHNTAKHEAWVNERANYADQKTAELVKEIPEIMSVIDDNADIIEDFSPEIKSLFLEADNAPLAFYNLAKEGKLEALASMSPAKAAMEIGRAQTQAITKPKTKAPTPMPASRGSVPQGKSLDDMSGDEMRRWLRST